MKITTTSSYSLGLWLCHNCKVSHSGYFITCGCGAENITSPKTSWISLDSLIENERGKIIENTWHLCYEVKKTVRRNKKLKIQKPKRIRKETFEEKLARRRKELWHHIL